MHYVLVYKTGLELSWLERTPDKREVGGSSPLRPINIIWGYSSAGRAPALQAGGQQFDSAYLHQPERAKVL